MREFIVEVLKEFGVKPSSGLLDAMEEYYSAKVIEQLAKDLENIMAIAEGVKDPRA
jgi:predicted house-cleaning noncanonical NTP pyrophosphatase (MazG superfamily)